MSHSNYQDLSRRDWDPRSSAQFDIEDIRIGALLRIAESMEKIAGLLERMTPEGTKGLAPRRQSREEARKEYGDRFTEQVRKFLKDHGLEPWQIPKLTYGLDCIGSYLRDEGAYDFAMARLNKIDITKKAHLVKLRGIGLVIAQQIIDQIKEIRQENDKGDSDAGCS